MPPAALWRVDAGGDVDMRVRVMALYAIRVAAVRYDTDMRDTGHTPLLRALCRQFSGVDYA